MIESIERLDNLIDLDFERDWNAHLTASRFFLDSTIEINGNPLGIAVANIKEGKLWYEIILNGGDLVDDYYRRYVFLHEYGHTLGLEHPFDDQDGDSAGGTDPWTSKIYPEDTVMAYREPQSGEWPQWFSDSDIRALVKMWGLEDDVRGSYQVSYREGQRQLLIGDPTNARKLILSGEVVLQNFIHSQREVYGSSWDDKLVGYTPKPGGWTHEWFYSGEGDDLIIAGGGRDQLLGGFGDDTLRGGHGQDVCEGGIGNDQIYGGGEEYTDTRIGEDSIFVLSDQISHGEAAGRLHKGSLADVLVGVESHDKITILGHSFEELDVVDVAGDIGIEANNVLEAIIIESEVTKDEIISMLHGDTTRWF